MESGATCRFDGSPRSPEARSCIPPLAIGDTPDPLLAVAGLMAGAGLVLLAMLAAGPRIQVWVGTWGRSLGAALLGGILALVAGGVVAQSGTGSGAARDAGSGRSSGGRNRFAPRRVPRPEPAARDTGAANPPSPAATAPSGTGTGTGSSTPDLEEPTTVDFRDVDIKVVLHFLAERTRTNYFFDPSIAARITVIGPHPIPLREAVSFLEAALESRGYTVVDSGSFKEVIPRKKAPQSDVPLRFEPGVDADASPLEKERTVTEMIELRHAPIAEIKAAIAGLVSEAGNLVEHAPSNRLILTDSIRNLERLHRVIAELDVPVRGKRVHLMPVRFRKADDLARGVTEILAKEEVEKRLPQTREMLAARPAVLADPPRNLLVVVASSEDAAHIRRLVADLDLDPGAGPPVERIALRFADPSALASQIGTVLKIPGSAEPPGYVLVPEVRTRSLLLRSVSPALAGRIRTLIDELDQPSGPTAASRIRVYRLNYARAEELSGVLQSVEITRPTSEVAPIPGAVTGDGSGALFKVAADEHTNSLVVTAPDDLFPTLESVIRELDVFKPQVMVEVLIAEVDYDWARGMGLDFNALNTSSSSTNRPFAIGNADQIEGLFGGGLANGLSFGMLHGRTFDPAAAASGNIAELSKIGLLVRMFQNSAHANILSSPVLMASDNETSKIAIGERIQLPASFATAANTGLNTITSFNSEDLGVILEITPRVTHDGHVILKVDQKIKARTGDVIGGLQTPVLSNREVATQVHVADGDTVVVGGLLSEEENRSESRIPLLSSLPGIGKLFRSRSRSTRKTNLLVFLTPHILGDDGASRRLTSTAREDLARDVERSRAGKGSVLRQVFQPSRSLGRFQAGEGGERSAGTRVGDPGPESVTPEPDRAATRVRIESLFARIRSGLPESEPAPGAAPAGSD